LGNWVRLTGVLLLEVFFIRKIKKSGEKDVEKTIKRS
jgi:hypothetical protein